MTKSGKKKVYQLRSGARFLVSGCWEYELIRLGPMGAYVRPIAQKAVTIVTADGSETNFARDSSPITISDQTECELIK